MDQADIQVVERTSIDKGEEQMTVMAKLAAQVLTSAYPNHLWMVGWAPGAVLVIKYGSADARFGYTVDAGKAATISEFERAVKWGGGELLERLGMPRGAWNGEDFGKVYDGADEVGPNKVRH